MFPLHTSQPSAECYPPNHFQAALPMSSKKLILLIEYETSVRGVLQVCLSRLGGWDVLSVSSIQGGLEILMTQEPDAILLDVARLEMDNFKLVRQFRKHVLTQPIPILLITAKARWFSHQQLQEMGIVGAIAKPFNPTTLPTQIAELLKWVD